MASSFQRRRLRFTIQLANGTFNKDGNPDTVVIEDFRAHVEIQALGGYMFSSCKATIFGLSKETMDRLTFINLLSIDFHRNTIQVEATDDNGEFSVVFFGEILNAAPMYANAPSVPIEIAAQSGVFGSLKPQNPDMFPGPQKVAVIFERLAKTMGLRFENSGVETIVTDMVLTGTTVDKIRMLQEATEINVFTLFEENVLSISPAGQPRKSEPVEYSPENGLVGWPTRLSNGVVFKAVFRPSTRHGCKVKIKSSIPITNGVWYVISMTHSLSCQEPGGPWFTDFLASPAGLYIATR